VPRNVAIGSLRKLRLCPQMKPSPAGLPMTFVMFGNFAEVFTVDMQPFNLSSNL
jgi:hypothetical protein